MAEKHDLPRVVTVQNEYSLLQRIYDLDMAEVSRHEDVGLLAWSPLGAGLLTGKYENGEVPAGSRKSINSVLGGRFNPHMEDALQGYLDVAKKHGQNAAQMSIAFCLTRPFMTSVIIGATTMDQLKANIAARDLVLSEEIMEDIFNVFRRYPNPM